MLNGQSVELDRTYMSGDSEISFEMLKFYIGKIQFFKNEEPVNEIFDSFRLIDFSDSVPQNSIFEIPVDLDFHKIQFQLGIDSATHQLGIMGGDLDPTKGMYWAWNTGYINLKIEGFSSLSSARDKSFQYHLGGYMQPFETVQTIRLDIPKTSKSILKIDVSKFLSAKYLAAESRTMSPGAKAKELSKVVSTIFYFDEQK